MKNDLVIWDFNGTIIDDVELGITSVNKMLERRGIATVTGVEEYRRRLRFPIIDYYRDLGFDFDAEPYKELSHEWIALYNEGAPNLGATVGAIDAIREISEAGVTQVIISASEQKMMLDALDRLGVTSYFDEILGQDNIYAAGKLDTARDFRDRCHAKKPIVIGDTLHDFEMASTLGADCILYTLGHCSMRDLKKTGALLVDDLRAAARIILG